MKKFLFAILFIVLTQMSYSQVAISNPSSNPDQSAMLDVKSTTKGVLFPRMTYAQKNAIANPALGLIVMQTDNQPDAGSGLYIYGAQWEQISLSKYDFWSGTGNNIYNRNTGNIGIGTSSPADKLDLEGSFRLSGESRQLKFETGQAGGMVLKYAPGVRFIRSDNTLLGVMEYVDTVGTNFLRLRTGTTITNDFVVTTGHDIGIGNSNPHTKLEVRANGSGEVLRVHATSDPLMQFSTGYAGEGLGLPLVRKGFLDVNGNDFRIGTNAENNTGNFVIRVNGNEVMKVTPEGLVNIPSGADASLTSDGYIMLGTVAGSSIVMDNNEIIARGSNGAAGNLVLQNDGGTVRIGNVAVPAGYKFAINGKAICEELKVKLSSSGWPDYVFANNYKLRTLPQLEKYIQQNKHLPNIPSAAEVEKNGIEVGDMQKKMMEKIEELTLYIIDLQKQIDELKAKDAVSKTSKR